MKQVSKIDRYVIKKVRERRMAVGMSQANLSYELNMSSGFIGQAESERYPTHYNLKHVNEIARILRCSIYDLLPEHPL
ncbi:MAG: helix-turn-helix transcriptional regulator [Bacteroidota bacterium]|nr:helix-turn-helix transcriptional regulator [Bacteroidota bacterium]